MSSQSFSSQSSDLTELTKIAEVLSKMIKTKQLDNEKATECLDQLKRLPISTASLKTTGVGRSVNDLRRLSTDNNIIMDCKGLLKVWKRILAADPVTNAKTPSTPQSCLSGSKSPVPSSVGTGGLASSSSSSAAAADKSSQPTVGANAGDWKKSLNANMSTSLSQQEPGGTPHKRKISDGDLSDRKDSKVPAIAPIALPDSVLEMLGCDLEEGQTNGEEDLGVRLKCREMLAKSLMTDDADGKCADIAIRIEKAIYADMGSTAAKYRSQIRRRVFNLKDSKNPELRQRVLSGEIEPEKLARMTADEMASEEMRKARQKMTKEAIDEHQMAISGGTVTDLLQCSRCKKNNCTYNQVQTRSADEPMTTFALCNSCGHRWKFN